MLKIVSAEFLRSVVRREDLPKDGFPQVAFAGRSNVGKSSLINCILRRRNLAKTSKTPGKTRVLNFFLVNDKIHFVDLPGYGYAKVDNRMREMWVRMLDDYFADNPDLRLVVWLLDVRRTPSEQDRDLWEYLAMRGRPTVVALTKCDKLSRSRTHQSAREIRKALGLPDEVAIIPTSAQAKTGAGDLLAAIQAHL